MTHLPPTRAGSQVHLLTDNRTARVLLIESNRWDGELIAAVLVERGYTVRMVAQGLVGLGILAREPPDVIILDPDLVDVDGFALCQRMRELSTLPILLLSNGYDESVVVRGLGAGADDVLPRTIGLSELLARLEAILRRARPTRRQAAGALDFGELRIDTAHRVVMKGSHEVRLSPHEYRLLFHLALNSGMVVTRDELLSWIWGAEAFKHSYRLRVTINRLRSKLEDDPARPRYVLTRRGVGYMLVTLPSR